MLSDRYARYLRMFPNALVSPGFCRRVECHRHESRHVAANVYLVSSSSWSELHSVSLPGGHGTVRQYEDLF